MVLGQVAGPGFDTPTPAQEPLPAFISIACAEALENHYGVKEIAERYAARRTVFLDAIRGANEITVRGSEGGMYVMLDVSAVEPDDEKFAWALLDKEKVGVMPGSSFKEAALRLRRFASNYRREAA